MIWMLQFLCPPKNNGWNLENGPPGKGESFWKASFSGSMIVFWGVVRPEFPSILKRSHCFKFAKICGR